jgi:hypothetical protein
MYVPLVQAVMPEELVHQSRTAGPREEEPDAKGRYPSDRLSSLLSGLRCLETKLVRDRVKQEYSIDSPSWKI